MGKYISRTLIGLLLVLCGSMLFLANLWGLDWIMWYCHDWVYIPFTKWWHCCVGIGCPSSKVCPPPFNELGSWVNARYYLLVVAMILACIGSYILGTVERKR